MTWTLEQFGGVGDGSTDNTTATLAFKAAAVGHPNAHHVLNLKHGGHYLLKNPFWTTNIRDLTVNGPATLEHPSAGAPIYPAGGLESSRYYRKLIDDVSSGSSSVFTLTASDASNFAPGEWVLIGSHEQQYGGQPCNNRFFDFRKVTRSNRRNGEITLHAPLKYSHSKDLPYNSTWAVGDGRASIFKLEATYKWDVSHTYNDVTFVSHGSPPSVYINCRRFVANRCSINGNFLVTCCEYAQLNDCSTTGYQLEIDKEVGKLELNNFTTEKTIVGATGCDALVIRDSTLSNGLLLGPKSLQVINCTNKGGLTLFNAGEFCEELIISGGTMAALPAAHDYATQVRIIQVGTDGVTWNGSTLTIPNFMASGAVAAWVGVAFVGRPVYVVNVPGDPHCWPTGVAGRIKRVRGGDRSASLDIDFNAMVNPGDKLCLFAEPYETTISNVMIGGTSRNASAVLWPDELVLTDYVVRAGFASYRVLGVPSRLEVNVKRPYIGSHGGDTCLTVEGFVPLSGRRLSRTIDLKTIGSRVAAFDSNFGWTGTGGESAGSNLNNVEMPAGCVSSISIGGKGFGVHSADQLPIIDLSLHLKNPLKGWPQ